MKFPYKLVDLTHTIDEHTVTWNGDCGFKHQTTLDYSDCKEAVKFRVMKFHMHAGIGTHIDAPSHCIPGAAAIHDISIEDLCLPCVVIDVSSKAHERYSVSVEDILAFEKEYGIIPKNACVMIHTGWAKFWSEPEKYRNNLVFPSVSLQAGEKFLQRGIKLLGIDTLSADRPDDGFKIHQAFLGNGNMLLENVAHLEKLPPAGSFIMAFPLKIKNATEAPIRLVGLVRT